MDRVRKPKKEIDMKIFDQSTVGRCKKYQTMKVWVALLLCCLNQVESPKLLRPPPE